MAKKTSAGNGSGLAVKAYYGDGSVMLAFDLDQNKTEGLAGFAIQRRAPENDPVFLSNRINFTNKVTSKTTPEERKWFPSNEAPFQKFRWVDFPGKVNPAECSYKVTAMYFDKGGKLREGDSGEVSTGSKSNESAFEFGFTRGYLSSQAYADEFKNAPIRPAGAKKLEFDSAPFQKQYEWLGFHARKMVFDFLDACVEDKNITVDLFAYDLDEPDFVRGLQKLGNRLRAYLDNAPLHTKPGAVEIDAHQALSESAGEENVKQGHFHRFSHDKILVMKKKGKPVKVLTGSANFSVRGLYVQANNVLIFDDDQTAALYETAFEEAFTNAEKFSTSEIAEGWHDVKGDGLPQFSVAFSPHKSALVSLSKVADAIETAKSSVLFAVMELGGSGPVMEKLKELPSKKVFSYGMTQNMTGLSIYKPGESNGIIVPFSYLKEKVPEPFREEFSGGAGQVIHHKFVVVDFNTENPIVFTGSSNLASGGEESNGDNLLAINDPLVAQAYAIEAIRLVDHYHFRAAMKTATDAEPLTLQGPGSGKKWWEPYYDEKDIRSKERQLFA